MDPAGGVNDVLDETTEGMTGSREVVVVTDHGLTPSEVRVARVAAQHLGQACGIGDVDSTAGIVGAEMVGAERVTTRIVLKPIVRGR